MFLSYEHPLTGAERVKVPKKNRDGNTMEPPLCDILLDPVDKSEAILLREFLKM